MTDARRRCVTPPVSAPGLRAHVERVTVHCRIRPTFTNEVDGDFGEALESYDAATATVTLRKEFERKQFRFDSVFPPRTSQEDVFNQVAKPVLDGVLNGFNGTIFAYGQTGTGKTHTMIGSDFTGPERGIIPRAVEALFDRFQQDAEHVYTVYLSFVQIYMEMLQDLLQPSNENLRIREDPVEGVFVSGCSSFIITSVADCLRYIQQGDSNRVSAFTKMNAHSSRSHAVLLLRVEKRKRLYNNDAAPASNGSEGTMLNSTLFLVDLAGSERVKKTGAHGLRLGEAKAINLSLSALGNCIHALSELKARSERPSAQSSPSPMERSTAGGTAAHIPFRDSKLTRLLQDSLGGTAKTALVITVCGAGSYAGETLSSLQFGQRAMKVQNTIRRHNKVDYQALALQLQADLDSKDDQMHQLQLTAHRQAEAMEAMKQELESLREERLKLQTENTWLADQHRASSEKMCESMGTDTKLLEQNHQESIEHMRVVHAQEVERLQAMHREELGSFKEEYSTFLEEFEQQISDHEEETGLLTRQLQDEKAAHLQTQELCKSNQEQLERNEELFGNRISELVSEKDALKEVLHKLRDTHRSQTHQVDDLTSAVAELTCESLVDQVELHNLQSAWRRLLRTLASFGTSSQRANTQRRLHQLGAMPPPPSVKAPQTPKGSTPVPPSASSLPPSSSASAIQECIKSLCRDQNNCAALLELVHAVDRTSLKPSDPMLVGNSLSDILFKSVSAKTGAQVNGSSYGEDAAITQEVTRALDHLVWLVEMEEELQRSVKAGASMLRQQRKGEALSSDHMDRLKELLTARDPTCTRQPSLPSLVPMLQSIASMQSAPGQGTPFKLSVDKLLEQSEDYSGAISVVKKLGEGMLQQQKDNQRLSHELRTAAASMVILSTAITETKRFSDDWRHVAEERADLLQAMVTKLVEQQHSMSCSKRDRKRLAQRLSEVMLELSSLQAVTQNHMQQHGAARIIQRFVRRRRSVALSRSAALMEAKYKRETVFRRATVESFEHMSASTGIMLMRHSMGFVGGAFTVMNDFFLNKESSRYQRFLARFLPKRQNTQTSMGSVGLVGTPNGGAPSRSGSHQHLKVPLTH
eukprot:GILJ01005425.1.p1 GENE.GILJ01005425.1~~GILJ01005425.1.p1  ORF type:complete len:1097 (-),score=197.52 GILJ01005425.1:131-3421(-)